MNLVAFATNSHPQAFTPPIGELVKATCPEGITGKRFVRLRVTRR